MTRPVLRQALLLSAAVSGLAAADWPMLGGRPDRNMVSPETGLATDWEGGAGKPARNIRWSAPLGRVTFSNPAVSQGRVFVGTDNDEPDPAEQRGVFKCFSERDGSLLWRVVHEKLHNPGEDEGSIGICSSPCVDGDRVYYVSNRAELVCRAVTDGRLIWSLDMRASLGVSPNQASASSPLAAGELVFVVTGHGADYKTGKVKNPAAPSFVAVHRATGKVAWQDSSPGTRILTGQWASPGYGVVDGQPQVAFPGGDGWLYAFEPATGKPLWKFNCKAHEKRSADGEPETTFNLVAAPVFSGHRVLIAVGEPEASSGPAALRCLDARKRGDITAQGEIWKISGEDFNDSISTVAVHENLVFAVDTPGYLNCLELETGRRVWVHDLKSNVWGSPLVADGRVFVQTSEGTVFIFHAGREKRLLAQNSSLPDMAHGTPVAANGVLYFTGQKRLYAVAPAR